MPSILPALLFTCLACIPFSRRIKKNPIVFYVVFGGCALLTFLPFLKRFPAIWAIIQLFSSCYTGVAFYLAVMFAGAIPKSWQVTKRLLSIRSEMSIAGGFVIFAHCVRVAFTVPLSFSSYWGSIWSEAAMPMLIACDIVGPALLICFMVPWVTSFPFVRKNMSFKTWKKTQRLAYPFMALLVLQGFLLAVGHGVYVGGRQCGFRQVCSDRSDIPGYRRHVFGLKDLQRWRQGQQGGKECVEPTERLSTKGSF